MPQRPSPSNYFRRQTGLLAISGLVLLSAGMTAIALLGLADYFRPGWYVSLPAGTGLIGAALALTSSAFFCSSLIAGARARMASAAAIPKDGTLAVAEPARHKFRRFFSGRRATNPSWIAGWPQASTTIACVCVGFFGLALAWRRSAGPPVEALPEQIFGALSIGLGFPLLVAELSYSTKSPRTNPDAPPLARLLFVSLLTCVSSGVVSFAEASGLPLTRFGWIAIGAFLTLVGSELVMRAVASAFLPYAQVADRRSVADSALAGALRSGLPDRESVNGFVQGQIGIDLSRSRALAFLRRALAPTIIALALGAWALTGVTAIGVAERAVYERLGAPVAVLGPGLHTHFPWPFGIMRRVELDVVHEVSLTASAGADEVADASGDKGPAASSVEARPPVAADRLWDGSHPAEATFLIANESRGQQGFQIANVDLRVMYRVGLSDEAARQFVYAAEQPEGLLRAITGRMVARYFARYTLTDIMGQSRSSFVEDFRRELQAELDRLGLGLEAIAVVVEAIHPPAGAANAYHNVQAAGILAQSAVSQRRADAVRTLKAAERTALLGRNDASAAAAETVSKATADSVVFNADMDAYRKGARPFLLERYFDRLVAGLSKSEAVIVDHRLAKDDMPTIDLRSFGGFADDASQSSGAGVKQLPSEGRMPGDED